MWASISDADFNLLLLIQETKHENWFRSNVVWDSKINFAQEQQSIFNMKETTYGGWIAAKSQIIELTSNGLLNIQTNNLNLDFLKLFQR